MSATGREPGPGPADAQLPTDPFHAGERALQLRAGRRELMASVGSRFVRARMPEQHREFFGALPFVVVGALDQLGRPQASLLAGPPGFMSAPSDQALLVNALPSKGDPLADALSRGSRVGLLGLEPHTRRRNRLNGVVEQTQTGGFRLRVEQSFGNCPKYIQARQAAWSDDAGGLSPPAQRTGTLDERAARLIAQADTFFIASSTPPGYASESTSVIGADVSHRGGKRGFVRVERGAAAGDDGWPSHDPQALVATVRDVLWVPDFSGNSAFNTLGNLQLYPYAGLMFLDFGSADILHVSVRVEVLWDGPEVSQFEGAQRVLRLVVLDATFRAAASTIRWGEAELSPHAARTGNW